MHRKRRLATLMAVVLGLAIAATLTACSTTSPTPSASPSTAAASPAASPKASPSSPSPASSSSASPSTQGYTPDPQAYQKAMENWPKVLEAARKEGQAIFYSDQTPDMINLFQNEFNKIDPKIQIQLMRTQGQSGALERLKAEQATKQYIASGYNGAARPLAAAGLVDLIEDLPAAYEPGSKWVASPFMDSPHGTITVSFAPFFMLLNTNLVPAGQEPKSWKDLADPKWKDKLNLWDPRVSGVARDIYSVLYSAPGYGPEVLRKIFENGRIISDSLESQRAVARGEAAFSIGSGATYETLKDGPVKLYTPENGPMATPANVVIAKNAPQLNIAKVFANWQLTKEGQKVLASLSKTSVVIRTDVNLPEGQMTLANTKLMPGVPFTWDLSIEKSNELGKVYTKWLDEMGK